VSFEVVMSRLPAACLLLLAAVAPGLLGAAETKPKTSTASGPAWSQAGKADAQQAFARQAATAPAPTGANPAFTGSYVFSGRADENYRPFFQWELRLKAGKAALDGLRLRLTTLDGARKPLLAGPWKDLPPLAPGAARDLDYKLNCPNWQAYQIELEWKGGKDTHLGIDKFSVPIGLADVAQVSYLVLVNQNFETAGAGAVVTYGLWNIGGQPVRDLVQTIHFRDDKGRDVATRVYQPEKADLPGGYVKDHKVEVKNVPKFATVTISNRMTDTASLDQGSFTGAKDVEIAKVHAEGKKMKARVRNGTGADIEGLVVTITLQASDGSAVKALDLPVGHLAAGAEQELSADIAGVPAWSGYEVGWHTDAQPAPAP
jgi:hypothetical protein